MSEPVTHRIPFGGIELAVHEWTGQEGTGQEGTGQEGAGESLPVFCVHGLTRNGRDFDRLAAALAPRRVLAIDIAGRGVSGRLANPADYTYPTYMMQCVAALDALQLGAVDWVGTSMGGILGTLVAGQLPARVRRMVLNDVGPLVTKVSLTRILSGMGARPESFPDLDAVERYFRTVNLTFGPIDDAGWRHIATHFSRPRPDGGYELSYDPAILQALEGTDARDIDLWPLWAAVQQPVLVLRGAVSDLFLRCTALGMVARGGVELIEFPRIGHAPSLMMPDQIAPIVEFLNRPV